MAQRNLHPSRAAERRFDAYLDAIAGALGHADRIAPARAYCTGLLLPGARKGVEPMAARLAPRRVPAATHQPLHHLVAKAAWRDAAVLDVARERVVPAVERHGPIRHWIVDDTGLPKKGRHSVGVARQHCGQPGKRDNGQVAVTLAVADEHASLPIAHRLYLPEAWADDPARRARAGVPDGVAFRTKPRIALGQIRRAVEQGVPAGVALADAGYGGDTDFRTGLTDLGLRYVVGVQASTSLWPPGPGRCRRRPGAAAGGRRAAAGGVRGTNRSRRRGWPSACRRRRGGRPPGARAAGPRWPRGSPPCGCGRPIGTTGGPRPAPRPEEWLLIEWPEGEEEPTKYWLSTLPAATAIEDLVRTAKGCWRIERDFRELKQELGLGHDEGRGWRGFHHHASLCLAAYGFLVAERCRFPPERRFDRDRLPAPAVPAGFRSRGAGAA